MISSNLCHYSDAYIHITGTTKVPNTITAVARNIRNKQVIFKICALFTNCINDIKKYSSRWCSLYWYSNVYIYFNRIEWYLSKTLGSLWQYYRDELALGNNAIIIDFPNDNNLVFHSNLNKK